MAAGLLTPSSVLTRPADANAYVQNDLIASSTTAGSIVVPSFTFGGALMPAILRNFRLLTSKTSGMSAFQGLVEFWSTAPTFTNGDNGAYAVATGAARWLGSCTTTIMTQVADGAYCSGEVTIGIESNVTYWTLKEADATGFTPASGQTFTLIPEFFRT